MIGGNRLSPQVERIARSDGGCMIGGNHIITCSAREGALQNMRTSHIATRPGYSIIIPEDTVARATDYLQALRVDRIRSGALLRGHLDGADLGTMTEQDLLSRLFDTKQPQIFAEMAVAGDGSDWNLTELGLLGDVSIAVPVIIFDDGNHTAPTPHAPPFSGVLIFTPGALLRNGRGHTPADWKETTAADGQVSAEGYYNLYRRRLLPVFRYINDHAAKPRSAFLTVPGLGCGQFAGPFRGQLGTRLQSVLGKLLTEYGTSLPNLKAVYFDPYSECDNARREIHGISYMVRPLRVPGNQREAAAVPPNCPLGADRRFFRLRPVQHRSLGPRLLAGQRLLRRLSRHRRRGKGCRDQFDGGANWSSGAV
jgi:hypothetical protein